MQPPSRKIITISVTLLGIAVLAATGFALRNSVLEQWYLRRLESEDSRSRKDAVEGLHRLGSVKAIPLLSAMIGFPGERDNSVRGHAAHVLGKLLARKDAIPYVLVLIQDEGVPENRRLAAWALGEIGVRTGRIVSALLSATNDESEFVRKESVESLGRLGISDRETIHRLKEVLEDDKEIVRNAAAEALKRVQGESSPN